MTRPADHRRARVRRIAAKRPPPSPPPPVRVRARYTNRPSSLDELAALVLELLDGRRRSGGR